MRYPALLALVVALAACSDDPPIATDSGSADTGQLAMDTGTDTTAADTLTIDTPAMDLGVDTGAADTGIDAGAPPIDLGATDAEADAVEFDTGTDVGVDVPADTLPDGCASVTVGNCCGVACPVPTGAALATCLGGRCGIGMCSAGFGDCDGNVANGCEVDTRVTTAHCGACGAPCAAGRMCAQSACVVCTSMTPDNCCGIRCPTSAAVARTCTAGRCGFECTTGSADCDGDPGNGCETSTNGSPSHCGRCGNLCPTPANATAGCSAGTCGVSICDTGFADCDAMGANGCEVDTRSDGRHCGRCANRCPSGTQCISSVCR